MILDKIKNPPTKKIIYSDFLQKAIFSGGDTV